MSPGSARMLRGPAARFLRDIAAIRAHLRAGGVIAYATESCFGLGCDPRNVRAIGKILCLKRRPWHKGLIVVASNLTQLRRLIRPLTAEQTAFATQYWPGPYTFLLPRLPRAPRALGGRHAKLAVRISAHPDVRRLCAALDMALVSTSANRAGHKPIKTARECARQFGEQVWVLPGRIGGRKRPSTIMDIETKKILRG
jgi:L-threonylcarbamoyladenylate synthase